MYTSIDVNKYLVSSHCVDWDSSGGVLRRSPTSGAMAVTADVLRQMSEPKPQKWNIYEVVGLSIIIPVS